jgi:hypothetical protein
MNSIKTLIVSRREDIETFFILAGFVSLIALASYFGVCC